MENRREEDKNIGNQSRRSNIQIMGVPEKEKQNGGNYSKYDGDDGMLFSIPNFP